MWVGLAAAAPVVVVLDPGHDPNEPGALGTTGVTEVVFNDRLAAQVAAELRGDAGLSVHVSRQPAETMSLGERVRVIAALRPDLVVSLHHDSVKPQFLSWRDVAGVSLPTCTEHHGFSIFAQGRGPHRDVSLRLARAVSRRYAALGLTHTTYHATPIRGENRRWLDEPHGIHAGDYLFLLRKLDAPGVLVESGFVVNPTDEAALRDPDHVAHLAQALAAAIREVAAELAALRRGA